MKISTIYNNIKALTSCLEMDIEKHDIEALEEDKELIEYWLKRLNEEMKKQNN